MRLWIIGVALVASAGCSGMPLEPASFQNSGIPSPVRLATPVAGEAPLVPPAPTPDPTPDAPADPAPSPEPEPIAEAPAPPADEPAQPDPLEGPCGAAPCAPPVVNSCPVGLVPVLGDVVTCELPPTTPVCPVGTHPVLGVVATCEAD